MRTYDFPMRRADLLVHVVVAPAKTVINPAAFGFSEANTDRWKLRFPVPSDVFFINSADPAVMDAEEITPASNLSWESEYVTLGTTFQIWTTAPAFDILAVAYYPTRAAI